MPHYFLGRFLYFKCVKRGVRFEKLEITIVILQPDILPPEDAPLLFQACGKLGPRKRNRQEYLNRINPRFADESAISLFAFRGRHGEIHFRHRGITENKHAMDKESGTMEYPSIPDHVLRTEAFVHSLEFLGDRRFVTDGQHLNPRTPHGAKQFGVSGFIEPDLNSEMKFHSQPILIGGDFFTKFQCGFSLLAEEVVHYKEYSRSESFVHRDYL